MKAQNLIIFHPLRTPYFNGGRDYAAPIYTVYASEVHKMDTDYTEGHHDGPLIRGGTGCMGNGCLWAIAYTILAPIFIVRWIVERVAAAYHWLLDY